MTRIRHGLFGTYSPLLHPIRWWKLANAHAKVCQISTYLWERRPFDREAWQIVSDKTFILFDQLTDYLG